jgi:hypothetical protein
MVVFQNRVYLAIRSNDSNGSVYMAVNDGQGWSSFQKIATGVCGGRPTLGVFQGRLFLAVRGNESEGKIRISSSADGTTWSSFDPIGGSTMASPSVAEFGGKLFLAVRGNWPNFNIVVSTSDDGTNWSEYFTPTPGSTPSAPCLVGHQNRCLLFVRGMQNRIHFTQYEPLS